jgi:hypothetical protein
LFFAGEHAFKWLHLLIAGKGRTDAEDRDRDADSSALQKESALKARCPRHHRPRSLVYGRIFCALQEQLLAKRKAGDHATSSSSSASSNGGPGGASGGLTGADLSAAGEGAPGLR